MALLMIFAFPVMWGQKSRSQLIRDGASGNFFDKFSKAGECEANLSPERATKLDIML